MRVICAIVDFAFVDLRIALVRSNGLATASTIVNGTLTITFPKDDTFKKNSY